jgi:cellulose synthase/poly-beta-1,6-N-acetylglucosamine synthase-like glycosyltransferase
MTSTRDPEHREGKQTSDRGERADRKNGAFPCVSVVVPVYEDPDGVVTTLGALLAQTYPTDRHEILVVDNGSSDDTPDIVERFATAHDHLRLLVEPAGGSYAARNAGIRSARGSLVSFIDADMWVEPGWLRAVAARMDETGADYLACDVELTGPSGNRSVAERYNRRTAFPVREYVEEWGFAPTCCLTVRRDVLEDVGPFDNRLVSSGDMEFGNRVEAAGYDLVFADGVTMMHPPRTTVSALVGKAVRIGRGRYQLRRYHPGRYGRPVAQLVNPLNYTPPLPRSMANYVQGWETLPGRWKLSFTLLAWVLTLAKAAGTVREAWGGSDGTDGTATAGRVGTEERRHRPE